MKSFQQFCEETGSADIAQVPSRLGGVEKRPSFDSYLKDSQKRIDDFYNSLRNKVSEEEYVTIRNTIDNEYGYEFFSNCCFEKNKKKLFKQFKVKE